MSSPRYRNAAPECRLFAVSFVAAITLGLLVITAIIAAVSGRRLAADVGNDSIAIGCTRTVIAWAVLAVVFWATVALTYAFGSSLQRGFRWASAGSGLATLVWVLYTGLFALYVNLLSKPEETYGAVAGIAITMLYVYATAFIVLLGYRSTASSNCVAHHERRRPHDADGSSQPGAAGRKPASASCRNRIPDQRSRLGAESLGACPSQP